MVLYFDWEKRNILSMQQCTRNGQKYHKVAHLLLWLLNHGSVFENDAAWERNVIWLLETYIFAQHSCVNVEASKRYVDFITAHCLALKVRSISLELRAARWYTYRRWSAKAIQTQTTKSERKHLRDQGSHASFTDWFAIVKTRWCVKVV